MKERTETIASARNELAALVHEVEGGETVTITRRGKAVAVIISVEEYRILKGDSSGFWGALSKFRAETDLETLDLFGALRGLRDQSPGRGVAL